MTFEAWIIRDVGDLYYIDRQKHEELKMPVVFAPHKFRGLYKRHIDELVGISPTVRLQTPAGNHVIKANQMPVRSQPDYITWLLLALLFLFFVLLIAFIWFSVVRDTENVTYAFQ